MKDVTTSAHDILISLDKLYTEAIDKNNAVSAQGEVDVETIKDMDGCPNAHSRMREAISKKTLCPLLGQDSSKAGVDLLANKNLLAVRAERECVSVEKALM